MLLVCISIICMCESYMKADRWLMGGDKLQHAAAANEKGDFLIWFGFLNELWIF